MHLPALQQSNTTGLVVISEEQDTRTLLIHEIQTQDIYQRQGGSAEGCFPSLFGSVYYACVV